MDGFYMEQEHMDTARRLFATEVYRNATREQRDARAWARAYRVCFWFSAAAIASVVVRAFIG
jgi:hypothetical protein